MNSNTRKIAVLPALALILPMVAKASGTVPTGTAISVTINQSISSKDANLGQAITGTVAKDVTSAVPLENPERSELTGIILLASSSFPLHSMPTSLLARYPFTN